LGLDLFNVQTHTAVDGLDVVADRQQEHTPSFGNVFFSGTLQDCSSDLILRADEVSLLLLLRCSSLLSFYF
jgi:hypothetical protein